MNQHYFSGIFKKLSPCNQEKIEQIETSTFSGMSQPTALPPTSKKSQAWVCRLFCCFTTSLLSGGGFTGLEWTGMA